MRLRSISYLASVLVLGSLAACGDDTGGSGGSGGSAGGTGGASSTSSTSSGTGGAGTTSTSNTTSTGSAAGGGGAGEGGAGEGGEGGAAASAFWAQSLTLCELVNQYRVEEGLEPIPISVALMTVAETHVKDLNDNPDTLSSTCNMHSWSDTNPSLYSGCCYTSNHAQAQCMWDKPKQITASWGANRYQQSGFEISASTSNPASALQLWKGSSGHNAVILNEGQWASYGPWPAMGCGAQGGYAHVWFGPAADPQTL
jgi:uncharacterized protein YkwD